MTASVVALAIASSALPLVLALVLTHISIVFLSKKGRIVRDIHKLGDVMVPEPGGPALIASALAGELLIYLFTGDPRVLAIILSTLIAFVIGLVDDLRPLGGIVKPALLLAASLPILILGTYSFRPQFPFFGPVRISVIYPILVFFAISITSNVVNTIDVLNGVASAFVIIVSIPLMIAAYLKSDLLAILATLPLLASLLGFYRYHRYPSRIFLGDSGTLAMGAIFGALTIVAGVEVVGIVALLPALLNSFFFITSVKAFIEHRLISFRPVSLLQDGKLIASRNPSAPVTLVRLILARGPMYERDLVKAIILLAGAASVMASITAILTWGL